MTFYVCGCSLNVDEIANISADGITNDSVYISDFIDESYGNVKIYKAKKRMELRLHPEHWIKRCNWNSLMINTTQKIEDPKKF